MQDPRHSSLGNVWKPINLCAWVCLCSSGPRNPSRGFCHSIDNTLCSFSEGEQTLRTISLKEAQGKSWWNVNEWRGRLNRNMN